MGFFLKKQVHSKFFGVFFRDAFFLFTMTAKFGAKEYDEKIYTVFV